MIVSHRYRFIFLKTTKTAGTSLEIALSRFCGPGDIVTPITPEDEVIRRKWGGVGPINYDVPLEHYPLLDRWRIRRGRMPSGFYNHMSAASAKALLPPDVWRDYFKFCVVRDPLERVVSYWHHQRHLKPGITLEDFLTRRRLDRLTRGSLDCFAIGDEVVLDHLCDYGRLPAELLVLQQRLGLPAPLEMPNAKGAFRRDRRPASEVLDAAQQAMVERHFARECSIVSRWRLASGSAAPAPASVVTV